jgi:hypothetical protein
MAKHRVHGKKVHAKKAKGGKRHHKGHGKKMSIKA